MRGTFIVRCLYRYDIAMHHVFQAFGRIERNDLTVVDNGNAAAIFSLFHIVGRHEDRDPLRFSERIDEVPDRISRLGVKAEGRLVQEQNAGVVEQAPGDLEPPLHAAGKILDKIVFAALQLDDRQAFR